MTVQRKLHIDRGEKTFTVVNTQDVEPILEHNKEARAKGNIDLQMYSPEFDKIVERKLADPDWAYLRTDKPAAMNGWLGFGS